MFYLNFRNREPFENRLEKFKKQTIKKLIKLCNEFSNNSHFSK